VFFAGAGECIFEGGLLGTLSARSPRFVESGVSLGIRNREYPKTAMAATTIIKIVQNLFIS
jgi:hypothetical protein